MNIISSEGNSVFLVDSLVVDSSQAIAWTKTEIIFKHENYIIILINWWV